MKTRLLVWLGMLACALVPMAHAVEILRWERLPLAVPLQVGEERIVFVDRNVRVGVPASVGDRLRVQSAGGAVYLRASEPIEPTRLQLQDADSVATRSNWPASAGRPKACCRICSAGWRTSVAAVMPICRSDWVCAKVTAMVSLAKAVSAGWSRMTPGRPTDAAARVQA